MLSPGSLSHIYSLLNFRQFRRVLSSQLLYNPGLDFPEPKWERTRKEGVGQHGEVGREGQAKSWHQLWHKPWLLPWKAIMLLAWWVH